MSSSVKKNIITLTRGDTLRVKVDIFKDEEPYIPEDGDVIRFALKHKDYNSDKSDYSDTEPIIVKNIPNSTLVLQLEPEDTKNLGFGTYIYDIQLTYADGTVETFITPTQFKLTEEVD